MGPPKPANIQIDDWGGYYTVWWRWGGAKQFGLLIFAVLIDIAMAGFFVFLFHGWRDFTSEIVSIHLISAVIAAAVFTYTSLCGAVNRTWVSLESGALIVRHGPLPWLGKRDLLSQEIESFFSGSYEKKSRHKKLTKFQLLARLKNGVTMSLLRGLDSREIPDFLVEILSQKLKLAPRQTAVAAQN